VQKIRTNYTYTVTNPLTILCSYYWAASINSHYSKHCH